MGVGKSKEPHGGPARPAKRVLAFTQDGNQTCASAGGKQSLLKVHIEMVRHRERQTEDPRDSEGKRAWV